MFKNIIYIIILSLIFSRPRYLKDNSILILNEKNFDFAKKEYKYLLVLFFNPENPQYKNFIQEYNITSNILTQENIVTGKIDITKNEKIMNRYKIKEESFDLLLFKGDKNYIKYEGNKDAENLKKWIEQQTKPEIKKINNKKELDKFIKNKNRIKLVYFGKNETILNEIILAERICDDIVIALVNNDDLIKQESPKDKKNPDKIFTEYINLYKSFDDKKNYLKGQLSSKNIIRFIKLYSYPKVLEFNDESSSLIYIKRQPALIIFSSKKGKRNKQDYNDSYNLLNYMWPNIKSKIKLFVCDISTDIGAKLAEQCGINENNIPKVYIVEVKNELPIKYRMEGGINEENMYYFIRHWSKGKLEPYMRSEEIPENKDDNELFKLVGKTFKKEVLDNDKDVLIYFVAPFCTICKTFEPILNDFDKKLKKYGNNKLLIAKMDAIFNDVNDDIEINNFPTIVFYPGNAKDKEPIVMKGRKDNIVNIEKFIKKYAFHPINDDEINHDL